MKKIIAIFGLALLASMPAAAHHSWASGYFINDPEIEVEGVISSVTWKNPHIRLEVTVDQGEPTEAVWLLETSSVAMLNRMNVTRDKIAIGEKVIVAGWPARQTDTGLYMNHMLLSTGVELIFTRDKEPRWDGIHYGDTDALSGRVFETDINKRPESIFAVWNTIYGDPNSHGFAAAKLKAQQEAEAAGLENRPPPPPKIDPNYSIETYTCDPKEMPRAMGNPYPIEFSQVGDDVQLRLEEYDIVRLFNIADEHDDSAAEVSLTGYSTGVWEGSKLVVTTTKVVGHEGETFVETFQMREDREYVDYTRQIVGEDAIASKYWRYVPGTEMEPYECTSELSR